MHAEEKETYALIKYMLSHNRHHAEELTELSEKLKAIGKPEAAKLLSQAVSGLKKATSNWKKQSF
jgi:hypothetical protein